MTPAPIAAPAETVLIVDDQEQNIRVVGTVLSMMGYEIVPATSGAQALKRLSARTPDLILLDMIMPEVDGLEVCRQIKAVPEWSDIPIIFLSAADDKNIIVQALEGGGVDYVTKPFNKAELLSRVRTHLALKKARDDLRHLAEDKDELLGILAHDLKNHLAGMRLSAGLLADAADALGPRQATLIENIQQSTDRMLAFVKEFLANQSAERLALTPGPVDLVALVEAMAQRHELAAAAKDITLRTDIEVPSAFVHADAEALGQVLDNLVSNAVKFSPPSTTVTLTVTPPVAGFARCSVQDEGPGFTADDQERMFRRYGRLSARPTGGEPSTGLGLSIVKRLIESLGGRIALETVPGRGARFSLTLPLTTPSEA